MGQALAPCVAIDAPVATEMIYEYSWVNGSLVAGTPALLNDVRYFKMAARRTTTPTLAPPGQGGVEHRLDKRSSGEDGVVIMSRYRLRTTIAAQPWLILFAAGWAVMICGGQAAPTQPETVHFSSKPVEWPGGQNPISVLDPQHIWEGLSYTADGGATWTGRFPPGDSVQFEHVPPQHQSAVFVTRYRGWLTGGQYIWQTEDGGET